MRCSTDVGEVISPDPWLRIVKEGYGTGFCWDLLQKDDLGTLVLRRGGTITGRVVDTQGKAVANVDVCVYDSFRERIATARTDDHGRYELQGVPGEQVLAAFYQRKNSSVDPTWLTMTVFARSSPDAKLTEVPRCTIIAKDNATVTAPDLVIGREVSVSGKLLPSKNAFGLRGVLVRLDDDWEGIVQADAEGDFRFPSVLPGRHRLAAFLPMNPGSEDWLGQAWIDVKPGQPLSGVQIQLATLTEVRVQFVDINGNALKGITAVATANKNGEGYGITSGPSDKDGWAVLYLKSWGTTYVRGFDSAEDRLVCEGYREVRPVFAVFTKVIDNVRIVMVPPASIRGQLTGETAKPADGTRFGIRLEYADGVSVTRRLDVDGEGRFELSGLTPGTVKLSWFTTPEEFQAALGEALELKPGEIKELRPITLRKAAR